MPRVSRVRMFINGAEMHDCKNFKTNDRELAKQVKLMNSTDYVEVLPEHVFSFDYVPRKGLPEYDFEANLDGAATVKFAKLGGGAYLFQACKVMTIGGEDFDGEKEMAKTVTVYANKRSDT